MQNKYYFTEELVVMSDSGEDKDYIEIDAVAYVEGKEDVFGCVINKNALDVEGVQKRISNKTLKLLNNHSTNPKDIVGFVKRFDVVDGVATVTAQIPKIESNKEIIDKIQAGLVNYVSVGYLPTKAKPRVTAKKVSRQPYVYEAIDLKEISLVQRPGVEEAAIFAVRNDEESVDEKHHQQEKEMEENKIEGSIKALADGVTKMTETFAEAQKEQAKILADSVVKRNDEEAEALKRQVEALTEKLETRADEAPSVKRTADEVLIDFLTTPEKFDKKDGSEEYAKLTYDEEKSLQLRSDISPYGTHNTVEAASVGMFVDKSISSLIERRWTNGHGAILSLLTQNSVSTKKPGEQATILTQDLEAFNRVEGQRAVISKTMFANRLHSPIGISFAFSYTKEAEAWTSSRLLNMVKQSGVEAIQRRMAWNVLEGTAIVNDSQSNFDPSLTQYQQSGYHSLMHSSRIKDVETRVANQMSIEDLEDVMVDLVADHQGINGQYTVLVNFPVYTYLVRQLLDKNLNSLTRNFLTEISTYEFQYKSFRVKAVTPFYIGELAGVVNQDGSLHNVKSYTPFGKCIADNTKPPTELIDGQTVALIGSFNEYVHTMHRAGSDFDSFRMEDDPLSATKRYVYHTYASGFIKNEKAFRRLKVSSNTKLKMAGFTLEKQPATKPATKPATNEPVNQAKLTTNEGE